MKERVVILLFIICSVLCLACSSDDAAAGSDNDTDKDAIISVSVNETEEAPINAESNPEQSEEIHLLQEEQQISEDIVDQKEVTEDAKKYVKVTGDNVNVRSANSLDGTILGKVKKDTVLEKNEDIDDWTGIIFNEADAYIKSEFLTDISEEEYNDLLKKSKEEPKENNDSDGESTGGDLVDENPDAQSNVAVTATPSIINKSIIVNKSSCASPPFNDSQERVEWITASVGDTVNYTVTISNDWGVPIGACLSYDNSRLDRSWGELFEYLSNIPPGESRSFSGAFEIKNANDKIDSDLFISVDELSFGESGGTSAHYWVKVK